MHIFISTLIKAPPQLLQFFSKVPCLYHQLILILPHRLEFSLFVFEAFANKVERVNKLELLPEVAEKTVCLLVDVFLSRSE